MMWQNFGLRIVNVKEFNMKTIGSISLKWGLNIPMMVILAKAGIQERAGCRIKSGITWLVSFVANLIEGCRPRHRWGGLLMIAFLALALMPITAGAEVSEKVPTLFENSFTYEAQENYAGALNSMLQVLRLDGQNYTAALRAGWLAYLSQDYARSAAYYTKAILLAPTAVEPLLGYLLPLMAEGKWQTAESVARSILTIDPDNYSAGSKLAYCLFSQGKYRESQDYYRKIITLYPADIDMKLGLAWACLKGQDVQEAKRIFRQVLNVRPNNPSALAGIEVIENRK